MFGVKRTITSYCFTLLSKMQMTPLFLVLLLSYALWRLLCRFTWIINRFPETRIWKGATWVQGCLWRYANFLDQPISIKFDHVLESWLCSIASCFEYSSVEFTVYQFIKLHLYMVSEVNGPANKMVFVLFRRRAARYVQRRPGGLLPEKLGGGVWPASQNPYPIYDQNLRYSLLCLWPDP